MKDLTPVVMNPYDRRDKIRTSAIQGVESLFPILGDHRDLEVNNLRVDKKDYSASDIKDAVLSGRTLGEQLKADVTIRDKNGQVIDVKKNHSLMRVPYFTPQNTFVVKGNEYVVRHQLRTMPGVYTRKRGNGELEASFNLAKGSNFRLSMDPEKGHMNMEYGSSKIPLYPVLRGMGMTHTDISKQWGSGVANQNQDAFDPKRDKHVDRLYKKLVPQRKVDSSLNTGEKVSVILDKYSNTLLDKETTKKTLGEAHTSVTPRSLLAASKKLLRVYKGEATSDERDSLEYQTLHSPEDFIRERLEHSGRNMRWKLKSKLDLTSKPEISKVLPSSTFTKPVDSFITTSQITTSPTQINPIALINDASSITRFGEGGIGSERAIPADVRTLHASHLGALDPFGTPESSKSGVDVRAAQHLYKDDRGRLHTILKNVRTSKNQFVPVSEIPRSTVAFSNQNTLSGSVDVLHKGKVTKVSPGKVDYQVPHSSVLYGVSTNLIPFLDSTQGNRAIMASKHVAQAVPLIGREAPLIQVGAPENSGYSSIEELVAKTIVLPTSPVSGRVTRVDDDFIHIRDSKGSPHKVVRFKDYPLASKTHINETPVVRRGDKVKKGQVLSDNNYTVDGVLALGKNLNVGYMAYRGLNSNDAVVISDAAADKLTSEHMVKRVLVLDNDLSLGDKKHAANFASRFTRDQYSNLKSGVVTPGTVLRSGDPIATAVRKAPPSVENEMFGRIHKSLRREYVDDSLVWEDPEDGEVVDVKQTGNRLAVTIKSKKRMKVGDKLTNRYGAKGVVSKIIPDAEMIQDASGSPIDLLWSSSGVISRINPGQIVETAAAKVAKKQGKPIVVQNFSNRDNVQWAKKLLKDNGLTDKEEVTDPITGKKIPNIMVGPQYVYKGFKSTDTNFSARGAGGSYDINQQPGRGGISGAKGMGRMEINGLLAHNARDILRENAVIKGTRNTEYWNAVRLGLPIPSATAPFAHNKFVSMLTGAGMRMNREGNQVSMAPLTNRDIRKMSSGVITSGKMVRAKDLRPEAGGLFDPGVTGGLTGQKWSHIELDEPVVSPVYRDSVRRILGFTNTELQDTVEKKGGGFIRESLKSIDIDGKIKSLTREVRTRSPGSSQDDALKQLKAFKALKSRGVRPEDAYILDAFPVLPPQFRPIVPGPKGDLLVSDVNHLYKDLALANEKMKEAKSLGLPDKDIGAMRAHLSDAVGAVAGLNDPVTDKSRAAAKKGIINTIAGTKRGFYNGKLISKRLDLTGRGTAAPDPSLGLDEVGLPEEMAWSMYQPFTIGNLVRRGHKAVRAKELVENRDPIAREALSREISQRPVILNRAPSLHKYSLVSAYPKMIPGKTIKVNPFIEAGMNLDYDGDALQLHLPATPGGVSDAKKMLISENIMGTRNRDSVQVFPELESVIGLYKGTTGTSSRPMQTFSSRREALEAYRKGDISLKDPVRLVND
jgi:DNA-directed RNA polymerase beta subunit